MLKLGIVGANGTMGKAIAKMTGLRGSNIIKFTRTSNNLEEVSSCDTIILCVKPNKIEHVCKELSRYKIDDQLVVSIAAGVPDKSIRKWINPNQPENISLVRCMLNLPIEVKSGVVDFYSSKFLSPKNINNLHSLFSNNSIGWLTNESHINTSTVISGCIPAYFAYDYIKHNDLTHCSEMITKIILAGRKMGFTDEMTISRACVSLRGTSLLLKEMTPTEIINKVATKGGATEAGIEHLQSGGNLNDALLNSYQRILKIEETYK
jgi:pyrroline-5-carboxylate reductase